MLRGHPGYKPSIESCRLPYNWHLQQNPFHLSPLKFKLISITTAPILTLSEIFVDSSDTLYLWYWASTSSVSSCDSIIWKWNKMYHTNPNNTDNTNTFISYLWFYIYSGSLCHSQLNLSSRNCSKLTDWYWIILWRHHCTERISGHDIVFNLWYAYLVLKCNWFSATLIFHSLNRLTCSIPWSVLPLLPTFLDRCILLSNSGLTVIFNMSSSRLYHGPLVPINI